MGKASDKEGKYLKGKGTRHEIHIFVYKNMPEYPSALLGG